MEMRWFIHGFSPFTDNLTRRKWCLFSFLLSLKKPPGHLHTKHSLRGMKWAVASIKGCVCACESRGKVLDGWNSLLWNNQCSVSPPLSPSSDRQPSFNGLSAECLENAIAPALICVFLKEGGPDTGYMYKWAYFFLFFLPLFSFALWISIPLSNTRSSTFLQIHSERATQARRRFLSRLSCLPPDHRGV